MASIGFFEIILAFTCFCFLWILRQDYNLPWDFPLVGMLPGLFQHVHRIHEGCTEILQRSGGTFLFKGPWFANMDMLGTIDPDNVHYIMSANFANYPKGPHFREMFDVLGDGIFNSDLDLWKNQRKLARALINHQGFYKFLIKTSRNKVEKGLIPILEHFSARGEVVDLQDVFQRLTFDSICILVTGYDPGCLSIDLPDVRFSRAMDDAEEAIFMRHVVPESIWKLQRWLNIGVERKMSEAWETLDSILGMYVSKKREEIKKGTNLEGDEEAVDLITSYIKGDGEATGLDCDDKFLRDTILNLMIAGRDTTSSALTWFLWLVSRHPSVEEKIREELKSIIPAKESGKCWHFDVQELRKLVYLHGALCESLRLYPPVPFQHKEPVQPDILPSGHRIHTKLKIMIPLYAMGRMESTWGKDCMEFKPERWISATGTIKYEPSYKFFSFNAGPRTCIGKEVAFSQMKAVAAAIIHNYNVRAVEGHPVVPNVSVILYMKHGFKVRVSSRWS